MPNLFEHLHGLDERPHMRKEWGRGPMESECVERCGSVEDAEQRVFYSRKRGKAVQMPNLFEHLHGLDSLFIHIPDHYKTV